jgi:Uma2 family endonuclease
MEKSVSTQAKVRITPEEYLEIERAAEFRSEYLNGEMFPMPGATFKHNLITTNVVVQLSMAFVDRPCLVVSTDMRIKVPSTGLFTYPDVIAPCSQPQLEGDHEDILLNPQLIVEVLSPSTESYDRGKKFAHYRTIESLLEYVLISQTECRVERFTRQNDGEWLYSEATDLNGSIELKSIACRLNLASIYYRVDLQHDTEFAH